MADLLRRAFAHQERAIDVDKRTIRFVASTSEKDRHGTIIAQDWNLSNFNRNPVFLWRHDDRIPAIGRVINWETGDTKSHAEVRFAKTEFGEEIFQLYQEEVLNAVSVGFDFTDHDFLKDVVVLRGNELYELSGLNLPGNASALVEGRSVKLQALSRALRQVTEPELGRKVEDADLDLLVAGALPIHLDKLRSFDALERRLAEVEKLLEQRTNPKPEEVFITL